MMMMVAVSVSYATLLYTRHAYVQIHAPIETANKSVKEIRQACFDVS
jgi:hypothetical protein